MAKGSSHIGPEGHVLHLPPLVVFNFFVLSYNYGVVIQQLIDYINQSRKSGIEDGAIRQALLGSGYSVQDIEEAFGGSGPTTIFPQAGLSEIKKPRFSFKFPKKLFKTLLILIIIVAVVIGGYYALAQYFPQYAKYAQPYLGPVLDPVLDAINSIANNLPFVGGTPYSSDDILKAFEKTVLIDSAKYNASLYVETQDKDTNLKPLVVKIPQGEVPEDLKKAITSYNYYPYSGIKSGDVSNDNFVVVDLIELKPAMDAKATDRAKLQLTTSILEELGNFYNKNQRDPAILSELKVANTSLYPTYGYSQWGSLEGKYFTYSVAPDLKSFELTITLDSKQSIEGIKNTIEILKKSPYYGNKFNEGSIIFDGDKVIFNERSVSFAYNLSYGTIGAQSVAEQIASLFSDGSYGGYLSYIPGWFKLNLNVGGIMQSKDSKAFYIQLGGKADFDDLVVEADFEFTNVDKESFFRINNFPSIFMDVSKVREEWIKLPTANKSSDPVYFDSDYYSSYAGSIQDIITKYREKSDRQLDQLRKLASIAEQEKIITAVGATIREEVSGKKAYKYLTTIDENKLPVFYEKAAAQLKEYGDEALVQENELTKVFFNSDGFKEIIKYLKDISDFYIWVDTSGYIIKFQYNLKYIPHTSSESQKVSNKQFYISSSIELSEINKDLEVKKPDKYIEWKEAESKLFGVTKELITTSREKARDAKRIADVNQLRVAAEMYFDDHNGAYPKELSISNLKQYFSSLDVPKDPITGKPYNYAYYPADKPTGFQIWTELEKSNSSALSSDADINSDKSRWVGAKLDASKEGTESCTQPYDNGNARDCIYDQGTSDAYNYKNGF